MLIVTSGRLACVKIIGRANFISSMDFKTLFHELLGQGYSCLVLDLAECVLMDSTFLGVMAGFGLQLKEAREKGEGAAIELLNPNTRIVDLLENLGVLHLFKVVSEAADLPGAATAEVAEPGAVPTHEEVTLNCLQAHQTLMEISAANIARFKDVTAFLAEDLKKSKTEPAA